MAASRIFRSVLDVMPDCNRKFLGVLVKEMMKQYDEFESKDRRFFAVPPLPNNYKVDQTNDEDYDIANDLENKQNECPDEVVFDLIRLIVERLLITPNYPKHVPRRAFSALENKAEKLPVDTKTNNDLLAVAAGGDRPLTAEPGLMAAASNGSSNSSPFDSVSDSDNPNYLPELYKDETMQLLTNEFRWLFVTAIKTALKLNKGEYSATRAFLLDLIGPELVGDDINIAAVDPVLPQYPRRIDTVLTKANGRNHLIKGENKFELLKAVRKVSPVAISVTHPRLATELATLRTQKSKSDPVTCLCCEDETTVDTLVTCVEGHIYCHACLIEYVKAKIQDGVKQGYLECMQNECSAPFSQNILTQRLPNDLMEQLDERIAMANINQANIADLVRCPKCQTVFELDSSLRVLECVVCKHASCRHCHQPWDDEHRGKKCEELETLGETQLRRLFEERMTAELIRLCPKCRTPIVKNEGCNKLTCSCKATMCNVCREPFIGYDHFCQHPRNPGQPCDQCVKCSLWIDPAAEDAARIKRIDEESKAAVERQKAARLAAKGLVIPKKQTTSDPVENFCSALSSMAISPEQPGGPAPNSVRPIAMTAVINPELDLNIAMDDVLTAAGRNDSATLERLVQRFGNRILNQTRDRNREVALHRAATLGYFNVVQTLLRLGADVSLKDSDDYTPLHRAVIRNDPRIIGELLNRGGNINEFGNDRMTALHVAARFGKADAARILIDRHANLELRDGQFNQTPLHFAAHYGRAEIAEMLATKGAHVRARDGRTGGSPLHHAAGSGSVEVVRLLLRHGASVNELNNSRRTPLHMCAFRGPGNLATARVLLEAGADVTVRDVTGRDALDNARFSHKRDIEEEIRRTQTRSFSSHKEAGAPPVFLPKTFIFRR